MERIKLGSIILLMFIIISLENLGCFLIPYDYQGFRLVNHTKGEVYIQALADIPVDNEIERIKINNLFRTEYFYLLPKEDTLSISFKTSVLNELNYQFSLYFCTNYSKNKLYLRDFDSTECSTHIIFDKQKFKNFAGKIIVYK